MDLYPLKFQPIFKSKIWGGQNLKGYHPLLPEGAPIGESWLIADHEQGHSIITNGVFQGKALSAIKEMYPVKLMGHSYRELYPDHRFPLLIKFLDASEILSLQVHPDDTYSRNTDYLIREKTNSGIF